MLRLYFELTLLSTITISMKLPFIQHIGIGLHITGQAIRWVELTRIRDDIKVRSTGSVHVSEGDVKSALSELLEQVNPSWNYVTVNIDPGHVRQKLIGVPVFEDEVYLETWLREQKEALIPDGLNREDFIVCHRFMGQPEDHQRCLLVIMRKQAVEARIRLLKSVGLRPSVITTGDLETGYAYLFDPEFTADESCLIKAFEDYSSLQFYSGGMLNNVVELTGGDLSVSEILEEAEAYLATAGMIPGQQAGKHAFRLVTDKEFGPENSGVGFSGNASENISLGRPLFHITSESMRLNSDMSVAAGMAVKQLYPALDAVNFLEHQHAEDIREEIQQKDAVHTGLILGSLIGLLLILLTGTQFFLKSKLYAAQQQVALLEDNITAVSEARERVAELRQRVSQARQLVGERTNMAGILEVAGRSVPQRTWLNEVDVYKTDWGKEVVLYGFAYNDALVASLMQRLENEKAVGSVRLIFSETVESGDVYSQADAEERSLVQFEIRVLINLDSL